MKKNLFLLLVMAIIPAISMQAQWTNWNTQSVINGVIGISNAAIQSAERKKQMEIMAQQKVEYQPTFNKVYEEAKELEGFEQWEDALLKYEEAAKLNCQYGYTDQAAISRKITSLYEKAGREEEGPSILNNSKVTLDDYSGYRYMRQNPVYSNKKDAGTRIIRVACSDTETRLEFEYESTGVNDMLSYNGKGYIKGNKGDKMESIAVENITVGTGRTTIPWPHQKLRFAIIFPPLPENATEFDFITPKTYWMYKDIKCK